MQLKNVNVNDNWSLYHNTSAGEVLRDGDILLLTCSGSLADQGSRLSRRYCFEHISQSLTSERPELISMQLQVPGLQGVHI